VKTEGDPKTIKESCSTSFQFNFPTPFKHKDNQNKTPHHIYISVTPRVFSMAEIVSDNSGAPEGNFEGWTKKQSKNGKTYFVRATDSDGNIKHKPSKDHDVDSHGPSFSGVSCYWPAGTSGSTSTDFSNQTGISWYKNANTVGWTYQLTINTSQTYDYHFHTADDSYELNVYVTSWTHEVTFTDGDSTIVSVDGK
jgi:hypothetical protein